MVKNQHYVPRCYLRNFSNAREQIWVYDKLEDKVFQSHIGGVACEKFFYDSERLEKETGEEQFIEKVLGILEDEAAKVFRQIIEKLNENRFSRLHPQERYFLAHYIAVQMLRTKEERVQLEQMFNQFSKFVHSHVSEEMKATAPNMVPPVEMDSERLAEIQGLLLSNPEMLKMHAEILDSHFWVILRAFPGCEFITSDHPVGKKANIHKPFRSMSGIASPGIEIVFPLSPDYCVCLLERTFFKDKLKKIKKSENKVDQLMHPANMEYYNYFQICHSTRFLFSDNDNFAFAKKVCDEESVWRNKDRVRVVSNHDDKG